MRTTQTSERKLAQRHGTVHLGKGWRNKQSMVTMSDFSEKTKGKNGKLYWDNMVKDLLCIPTMFRFYTICNG